MKAVHLLGSLLDQYGFEVDVQSGDSTILSLRGYDDLLEIKSGFKICVYCDFVTWIKSEPQLCVSLYHPRSIQSILQYLRCIRKRRKRSDS